MGVIHDTRLLVKIYYRPRIYNTVLIFIVLQITSIPHLSVLELSEAAGVSCGSFDQRGRREAGLVSPLGSWAAPLLLIRASCPRPGDWRGKCLWVRAERTNWQYSAVMRSTPLYCTVHCPGCQLASLWLRLRGSGRESFARLCCGRSQVYTVTHSHSNLLSMML